MKKFLFITLVLITSHLHAQQNDVQLANEYYIQGEIEKALDLYTNLAKKNQNISLIHANYYNLLMTTNQYSTAEKYMKRVLKYNPSNVVYRIDYALIYKAKEDPSKYDKEIDRLIEDVKADRHRMRLAAQNFIRKQIPEQALKLYKVARRNKGDKYQYAIELANVHRIMGNKDLMVEEYLNFVEGNPNNINYVKNVLQNFLTESDDLENLELKLIEKVQKILMKPFIVNCSFG